MDESIQAELLEAQEFARKQLKVAKERNKTTIPYKKVRLISYAPALLVALLKDLLDFAFLGSFPMIGTIVTFCFSILIFFLLFFTGSSPRFSLVKKGLLLSGGTLVEGVLFGLNFLPLEFGTVLAIYMLDKKANTPKHKMKHEVATFEA